MDTKKVAEGFTLSATFVYLFNGNILCQQVYRSLQKKLPKVLSFQQLSVYLFNGNVLCQQVYRSLYLKPIYSYLLC